MYKWNKIFRIFHSCLYLHIKIKRSFQLQPQFNRNCRISSSTLWFRELIWCHESRTLRNQWTFGDYLLSPQPFDPSNIKASHRVPITCSSSSKQGEKLIWNVTQQECPSIERVSSRIAEQRKSYRRRSSLMYSSTSSECSLLYVKIFYSLIYTTCWSFTTA